MAADFFNKLTTKEIEAVIIEGNPKAFKQLGILYFSLINNLIINMNGNPTGEDAKDIFQDTLLVLHKNLKENKVTLYRNRKGDLIIRKINSKSANKSKLSSYLYGIARNIWLNSPQNFLNNKEVNYTEETAGKSFISKKEFDKPEISPKKECIFNALQELTIRCQLIIILKKKTGLSHSEISELLNITHGSCRNLFAGCWKKLILKINDYITTESNFALPVFRISGLQQKLKKIPFINEITSFLLDVKSNTGSHTKYNKERNRLMEKEFQHLSAETKLLMLLYFVCIENISSITQLMKFTDDKSTENSIYKCTMAFADRIQNNKKVLELMNKND